MQKAYPFAGEACGWAWMGAAAEAWRRVELASKYLEEGEGLAEEDPVQASEKLYGAAEEAVKALALHFGLSDILERVEKGGGCTVTELDKAASRISGRLGEWFSAAWDRANYLHVWASTRRSWTRTPRRRGRPTSRGGSWKPRGS